MDRLGGRIEVESEENHGSTFTVQIPISAEYEREPSPEAAVPSAHKKVALQFAHAGTKNVLLSILQGRSFQVVDKWEDADFLWFDAATLNAKPHYVQNFSDADFTKSLFISYMEDTELVKGHLPELLSLRHVGRFKPPALIHQVSAAFDNTTAYMAGQNRTLVRPRLVRFASEVSERSERSPISTASHTSQQRSANVSPTLTSPSAEPSVVLFDSAVRSPTDTVPVLPSVPPLPTEIRPRQLVLLVEDNAINARLGARVLKSFGLRSRSRFQRARGRRLHKGGYAGRCHSNGLSGELVPALRCQSLKLHW